MDKDDVLKYLSETHRHLHDERRRYEIRFFVGYLTLNLAVMAAFLTGRLHVAPGLVTPVKVTTIAALLSLATVCILYLYHIHRMNRQNIDTAYEAERELFRRRFCGPSSIEEAPEELRKLLFVGEDGGRDGERLQAANRKR